MKHRSFKERYYSEANFGGYSDLDLTVRFYSRVHALIKPGFTVLDLGCGRAYTVMESKDYNKKIRDLRVNSTKVIGADVDPVAAENPIIDDFTLIKDGRLDLESESVDLIVSDFVMEHVEDPDLFFGEVSRVLKPGGYFCGRTTNKLGYVALAAWLLPKKFHQRVLDKFQKSRAAQDVFPAFYRVNTVKTVTAYMSEFSIQHHVSAHEAEPSYFKVNYFLYWVMAHLHKVIPRSFRNTLVIFAQKRGASEPTY